MLIFIGVQVYSLASQQSKLSTATEALNKEAGELEVNNAKFSADLEYISNGINMVKDVKSKFNYRSPEEKLYILVPPAQE